MVGGKVIGLVRRDGQPTKLHVRDDRCTDQCCVDVYESRVDGCGLVQIELGDSVWWQSGLVLWTPKRSARLSCGDDFDIQLPKVGYSHNFSHERVDA